MCFTDRDSLKLLSGGEFKLFAPVSSDEIFISFVGVMAGLLILAIALLGHLLGFHIYLIYHKMSTYEFIVSSRDHRSDASDVETGTKSPSSRKLFKNKVKPEEDRRENSEPERIEISDNGRSEGSEDSLPNETSVKFISEVSSKAAAKQSRSLVQNEPSQCQESPSNTTPDITHYSPQGTTQDITQYSPQGITECASSSEESLKEITPPPTTPPITIQQPAGINMASMLQPHVAISSDQCSNDVSSARAGPSRVPMVTFEDEVEKPVPSPQRNKKKKARTSEGPNTETLNNGDYELTKVNADKIAQARQDNVYAAATPRKKKKKVKATTPDSLPPVIVRRPLPQLQLHDDN